MKRFHSVSFPNITMLAYSLKRKPFSDISNTSVSDDSQSKKPFSVTSQCFDMHAFLPVDIDTKPNAEDSQIRQIYVQNVHPVLAMYQHDLITSHMGFAKFSELVSMDNEMQLLNFLTDFGLIVKYHQCEFCGGQMRKSKQGNI